MVLTSTRKNVLCYDMLRAVHMLIARMQLDQKLFSCAENNFKFCLTLSAKMKMMSFNFENAVHVELKGNCKVQKKIEMSSQTLNRLRRVIGYE